MENKSSSENNKEKSLNLQPVDLKVDRRVLIDSFNINGFQWSIDKTVEELIELADALMHFKKNEVANEQVCQEIADVFIQCTILKEVFGSANVQLFMNKKLKSIRNRNDRLARKISKVGF